MADFLPRIPGITCDFPRPDGFSRPDWGKIDEWIAGLPDKEKQQAAAAIELASAQDLAASISSNTHCLHSEHAILVAALPPEEIGRCLWMCELTHKWLEETIGPIPADVPGRHILVHFDDEEEFFAYLSPEDPAARFPLRVYRNEISLFAVLPPEDDHCQLCRNIAAAIVGGFTAFRELPLWIELGLQSLSACRLHDDVRMEALERDTRWLIPLATPEAMRMFWSGEAFDHPPEVSGYGVYALAGRLLRLILDTSPDSRRFLETANWRDAGESAARDHLGKSLAELAKNILGPGDWTPRPEVW